jgi:hypothetical protein
MAILRTFLMSMGLVAPAGDLRGSPAAGFKFGTGASPAGLTRKKKHSALKKISFLSPHISYSIWYI